MYGVVVSASAFLTRGGEVCDELLHGMGFRVLARSVRRGVYRIETEYGYRGDIRRAHVKLGRRTRVDDLCMVTGMVADVLAKASVRSTVLRTLFRGSRVRRITDSPTTDGFARVELADGVRGYIREAFLRQDREPDLRQAVVRSATRYMGAQYRWGGKSPEGIDCSGLCFMAYYANGITIYRDAKIVPGYPVRPIPREKMQPADLAFLPGHVAMYVGDGRFIHSSVGNNGVAIDRLEAYPVEQMVVGSAFGKED